MRKTDILSYALIILTFVLVVMGVAAVVNRKDQGDLPDEKEYFVEEKENWGQKYYMDEFDNPGEMGVESLLVREKIKNGNENLNSDTPFRSNKDASLLEQILNFYEPRKDLAENDWIRVALASEQKKISAELKILDKTLSKVDDSVLDFTMSWDFMDTDPNVYLNGNYVLYNYDDFDIQYELQKDTLKESIIFDEKPKFGSLVARLNYAEEYDLEETEDGSLVLYAKDKNLPVIKLLLAYLTDRKGRAVKVDHIFNRENKTITFNLDEQFLNTADYPVIFDPSVSRPSSRYSSRMVWNDDNNTAILFGGGLSLTGQSTVAASQETWLYEPDLTVPVYRSDHDYRITVCLENAAKLNFSINDADSAGNSGAFTIDTCVNNSCTNNGLAETISVPLTGGLVGVTSVNTYAAECFNIRIQGFGFSNNGANNIDAFYDDISGIPLHRFDNQYSLLIDGKSPEEWIPGSQGLWTKKMPAISPAKRSNFDMVWDNVGNQVILYGGAAETTNVVYDDTWIYTPPTFHHDQGSWTNKNPVSNPGKLYGSQMAWDGDSLILHGGYDYDLSAVINKTYSYDPTGNTWIQTSDDGPAVRYAAMEYSPNDSSVYLFGGNDGTNFKDNLWKYSGGVWAEVTDSGVPAARGNTDLVWDDVENQFVLFGGKDNINYYNDTYLLNISTNIWTKKTPVNSPSQRSDTAMCWDNDDNEAMYYGGRNGVYVFNDVWWFDPDDGLQGDYDGGNLFTPFAPSLSNAECDYFDITDFNTHGNADTTTFAIRVVQGTTTKYVNAAGDLVDFPVFISKSSWSLPIRVLKLTANTSYIVSVVAKDVDTGKLSDYSSTASISTLTSCGYTPSFDAGCDLNRSGSINSQIWPNTGYGTTTVVCVTGNLTINTGQTLTVQPGVVVKVAADDYITVNGYLNAVGTPDQPIYFTRKEDDNTPDGDTMGDGYNPTVIPAGRWGSGSLSTHGGIRFTASSTAQGSGNLDNVIVRYSYGILVSDHNYHAERVEPTIKNVTLEYSEARGVFANWADPLVTNIAIRNTNGPALMMFVSNYNTNIRFSGQQSVYNNTINGVALRNYGVQARIDNTRTWYNDLPYYVGIEDPYLIIESSGTLNVEPGAVIKFAYENNGGAYDKKGNVRVYGNLNAVGTAELPIYFTTEYDDSVGQEAHPEWFSGGNCIPYTPCDIHNDSNTTNPTAGDWGDDGYYDTKGGIRFLAESSSYGGGNLDWVVIKYGYGGISFSEHNVFSRLEPVISNTVILNSQVRGIMIQEANPSLSNMTIKNNSGAAIMMYYLTNTNVEFSGVQNVQNNGVNGVQLFGYSNAATINANRTWYNDIPYYLGVDSSPAYSNNDIQILPGNTLTLESGTIVKFSRMSGAQAVQGRIYVQGNINAIGAASQPIYFTSGRDDTVGQEVHPEWFSAGSCIAGMPCDTNGDGNATNPAVGDWGYDTTVGGIHFQAGSTNNDTGSGNLDNVKIKYAINGIYVFSHNNYSKTEPSIVRTIIENCSNEGIRIQTANPNLVDLTIRNNVGAAIMLYQNDGGTNAELSGIFDVHDNGINGIRIYAYGSGDSINSNRTWYKALPYYFVNAYSQTMQIDDGVTLTLEPGTIVKLGGTSYYFNIAGTLNAVGSASNPIVFTSYRDDDTGIEVHPEWFDAGICRNNYPCDTDNTDNSDGTAGDWGYSNYGSLRFGASQGVATGNLDYVSVKYGATGIQIEGHNNYSRTEPTISHTTIENGSGYGVYIDSANPALNDMTIRNNAWDAIIVYRSNNGTWVDLSGSFDVHDNWQNGVRLYNYGGNAISASQTFHSELPYYFNSANNNRLYNNSDTTLTVEPGAIIKFGSGYYMDIYGALNIVGTSDAPIYITSYRDDSAGIEVHPQWFNAGVCKNNYPCDTDNTDGSSGAKEDWGGVVYHSGSNGQVKYVNFRYGAGGSGVYDYELFFENVGGVTEIANNKFNFTNRGLGVSNSNLYIHHNEFISSSDYGVVFNNPPAGTIFEYNTVAGFNVGVYANNIANGLTLRYNDIDAVNYYVQNDSSPFQAGSCGTLVSGTSIDACVNNWGAYPVDYAPSGKLFKNPGNIYFNDVGVEVVVANGGEDWEQYSHQDIIWSTSDNTSMVALADLYYSIDDGDSWSLIESDLSHAGMPNISGSKNWTVLAVGPSDEALIKVNVKNNLGVVLASDISDANFSITEFGGAFPPETIDEGTTVTASVPSILSFTVNPLLSGENVNGITTTVNTEVDAIDYGIFTGGGEKVAAHELSVSTNGGSGYVVTLHEDRQLTALLATISDFTGTNAVPTLWENPPGGGVEGYFGYTTDDMTLGDAPSGRFATNKWAGLALFPSEVAFHNGAVVDQRTRVGYRLEVTSLQTAGLYANNLTYICTSTY
ncbi:MAG: Kelch repeat-containing protein [Patescibacteria group bacterium]